MVIRKLRTLAVGLATAIILTTTACSTVKNEVVDAVSPFVNPPIPSLDPAFQIYSVDATKGGKVTTCLGSTLIIPPDAFTDYSGKTVSGEVNIHFREFQDAFSIFLAGIPMNYRGGHFTTAGSFELRAEQNDSALFVRPSSEIEVRLSSMTRGDDYPFFFLDEEGKQWDSLGITPPEVNFEKIRLKKQVDKLKRTMPFPLNRQYFAFNYDAILDVYRGPQAKDQIPEKLALYGLGWENAEIWDWAERWEREDHPALMVWKNIHKKPFPAWINRQYGTLHHLHGNVYTYRVWKDRDSSEAFAIDIEVVMPLRALFAFPPEKWKNDYAATLEKVRAEEERLKTMAEVYRTFKINKFGIYNWDKLLNESESIRLASRFDWEYEVNETLSDLTVIYITGDNKGVINFPSSSWADMALLPDKGGRLFAVLPGERIGLFSAEKYGNLNFGKLASMAHPSHTFEMKTIDIEGMEEKSLREALAF